MKVAFLYNPKAGGYREDAVDITRRYLERHGFTVNPCRCQDPGDGTRRAAEAVEAGADMILVGGGDGTINEAVTGMLGSNVRLGILPLGSVNVLAREVGLPRDLEGALEVAVSGRPRKIHVAQVRQRCFLLMASVGLDAEIVYSVNTALKACLGVGAYILAGMARLRAPDLPELLIETDTGQLRGRGLIISNARLYAGSFVANPAADIEAPRLDLCVFTKGSRFALLRYALGISRGMHVGFRDVITCSARRVTVSCAERNAPAAHVQADGDSVGRIPVTVAASQQTVMLITPSGDARCA